MKARLHPLAERRKFAAVRYGRILSLLIALAVLLAPAGMMGRSAAMTATHDVGAATMEHCADKQQPDREGPSPSCCIVACSALLADPAGLSPVSSAPHPVPVLAEHHGLPAEAATPPPRAS